jgi:hypothetical protein
MTDRIIFHVKKTKGRRMALCRCLEIHGWPKGRTHDYVAYAKPVGYPQTALICGLCDNPGVIWLNREEKAAYENGQRIFDGPNRFTRMQTDDGGLHEGQVVGCLM